MQLAQVSMTKKNSLKQHAFRKIHKKYILSIYNTDVGVFITYTPNLKSFFKSRIGHRN